ncbi:glycosyltransferase family 2 protein [Candidatus Saccharibacteria bacterium]|nr:glycosyltransferase family 2 protein [Candidatus Saccharibacteria bacterium]
MDEKICIVIPVYNIEDYIEKCLNSVKSQTYTNLEVIVVDDGSTDGSTKKCKELCKNDSRFKVVSKSNGGLSDARNYGMRYCTCKYITFVDGDDYLDSEYVRNLVRLLSKSNADIACTNFVACYEDGSVAKKTRRLYEKNFKSIDAIENTLYQKDIQNSAWGKLYKTAFFDDIQFPKGKTCEDLGTFYKLFEKAKLIAYSSTQDYYYLQRGTSIMGSSFNESKTDGLMFCLEIMERYASRSKRLMKAAKYRTVAECMFLLRRIPAKEMGFVKMVRGEMKKNLPNVFLDYKVGLIFKLKSLLFLMFCRGMNESN